MSFLFFFFNDTATTEIYTLSLHDALPISKGFSTRRGTASPSAPASSRSCSLRNAGRPGRVTSARDRKSTRLNSSHGYISYAVFCLKKKKNNNNETVQKSQMYSKGILQARS